MLSRQPRRGGRGRENKWEAAGNFGTVIAEAISKAEALMFIFAVSFTVPCMMAMVSALLDVLHEGETFSQFELTERLHTNPETITAGVDFL
jgi:hypothetical protein